MATAIVAPECGNVNIAELLVVTRLNAPSLSAKPANVLVPLVNGSEYPGALPSIHSEACTRTNKWLLLVELKLITGNAQFDAGRAL